MLDQPTESPDQFPIDQAPDSNALERNDVKAKTPILVIIIAWIALIAGILGTLVSVFVMRIGGFEMNLLFLAGLLNLAEYVLLIFVSFGLRWMRRWALIVYTIGILMLLVSTLISKTDYIFVIIQAILLAYLWTINRQFK